MTATTISTTINPQSIKATMNPPKTFTEIDCSHLVKIDKMEVINDALVFVVDDEIMSFTDKPDDDHKYYYFIYCAKNSKHSRSEVIAHITGGAFNFEFHAAFLEAEDSSEFIKAQIINHFMKDTLYAPFHPHSVGKNSLSLFLDL